MDYNNYNNSNNTNNNSGSGNYNAANNNGNAYGNAPYGSTPNFTMNGGPYDGQYNGNPYNNVNNVKAKPKKQKKVRKPGAMGSFIGKVAVGAVIFGLVGGGVFTGVSYAGSLLTSGSSSTSSTATISKGTQLQYTNSGYASDLTDVSDIVSEVMPSVVAITNTSVVNYRTFMGVQSQSSQSCGSGIIISEDDDYIYIATNNHVVSGADSLSVQFCDDAVVDAEVQGTYEASDLAVVKVKKSDIPSDTTSQIKVATIGDSSELQVGDASIAIGNALGYGQSVTTGVISALGRSVTTQDETTGETTTNSNLIQTDAAINPGNSGGALLNANGQVIGINSVKYASTEVEGIGYAIPMEEAMPILEELIKTGTYVDTKTAYLGIKGGDVTSEMVAYGYPEGVYVSDVYSTSGSAKAGLQAGDIITAVDGQSITTMTELQTILKEKSAGDSVTLTVSREQGNGKDRQSLELTVELSNQSQLQE